MYFKDGAILPASGYLDSGERAVFVYNKDLDVLECKKITLDTLNMLVDNYGYGKFTDVTLSDCEELVKSLIFDYILPALRIDAKDCLNTDVHLAMLYALDRLLFEFWEEGYSLDVGDFIVKYNYLVTSELAS